MQHSVAILREFATIMRTFARKHRFLVCWDICLKVKILRNGRHFHYAVYLCIIYRGNSRAGIAQLFRDRKVELANHPEGVREWRGHCCEIGGVAMVKDI